MSCTPLIPGRTNLVPHLAVAVLAAREAGIAISTACSTTSPTLYGFAASADRASNRLRRQAAIHQPDRSPTPPGRPRPTTQRAERIALPAEAEADGRGVVVVDGRMVENLHVDNARRTLAIAAAIAVSTDA